MRDFVDKIIANKYARPGETRLTDIMKRVAHEVGSVRNQRTDYEWLLTSDLFIPGGRILRNAHRGEKAGMLNCFFLEISPEQDSVEGIMDVAKTFALVFKAHGGCGLDITNLRPKRVGLSDGSEIPGAPGFAGLFSAITQVISQNKRRGAAIILMDVSHPDILDFIHMKDTVGICSHANFSVKISDAFMKAVQADGVWEFTWKGQVVDKMPARGLYTEIMKSAHATGEPGVFFIDQAQRSPLDYLGIGDGTAYRTMGCNPCGEISMSHGECCCLGSLVLPSFVRRPFSPNADLDFTRLEQAVTTATGFLTDVLALNSGRYPTPEMEHKTASLRRIGLGVMGLADMLSALLLAYGTEKSVEVAATVMAFIKESAIKASIKLAESIGPFPMFSPKMFDAPFFAGCKDLVAGRRMANVSLLTVAPTGSTSFLPMSFGIGGVSPGIEPPFDLEYIRRSETAVPGATATMIHPAWVAAQEKLGKDKAREFMKTAYEVPWQQRLRMQSAIQGMIDGSISTTYNLPKETKLEAVAGIYEAAWLAGLKGLTIYRDGSRNNIVTGTVTGSERPRPEVVQAEIHTVHVACGKLYITVGFDELGKPFELFTTGAKQQGCVANIEAVARLMSHMLRSGIPAEKVAGYLKGTRCIACVKAGTVNLSCPDGMARMLLKVLGSRGMAPVIDDAGLEACPECGAKALRHRDGCDFCSECAYSKCDPPS